MSNYDKIRKLFGEPIKNISQAFYDDFVEANVRFRNKSGIKSVIIRQELAKCCKWCHGLAGIYNYEDAPKDVYRRHDNCKCVVTFKGEKGYVNVWDKKEFNSYREARIQRLKELQTSQISKNYHKTDSYWSNKITNHTKKEIEDLVKYARAKGIKLIGFENFDGDLSMIREGIDIIEKRMKEIEILKRRMVVLENSYALDKDTYAETRKRTIQLNGYAFRDREFLKEDYEKRRKEGLFTKESNYMDIFNHEFAHVLTNIYQGKYSDAFTIFAKNKKAAAEIIKVKISEYATKDGRELIAECFVKYIHGDKSEEVLKVLEHSGILKKGRS